MNILKKLNNKKLNKKYKGYFTFTLLQQKSQSRTLQTSNIKFVRHLNRNIDITLCIFTI
jgi:hypothetical protein